MASVMPSRPTVKRLSTGHALFHSKVYPQDVGADGKPTPAYFAWAKQGWSAWKVERHPMTKGAIAVFY
jgi:hypothetical protein